MPKKLSDGTSYSASMALNSRVWAEENPRPPYSSGPWIQP
jgi:hypothetical protein